jgi:hypothetical protein
MRDGNAGASGGHAGDPPGAVLVQPTGPGHCSELRPPKERPEGV